jgi:thioredoxin 1
MKEILHFTADWCMPCKRLKPILDEILLDYPDIKYNSIDVDSNIGITNDYNVQSVPTLIILVDGGIHKRHRGVATKEELIKFISE